MIVELWVVVLVLAYLGSLLDPTVYPVPQTIYIHAVTTVNADPLLILMNCGCSMIMQA